MGKKKTTTTTNKQICSGTLNAKYDHHFSNIINQWLITASTMTSFIYGSNDFTSTVFFRPLPFIHRWRNTSIAHFRYFHFDSLILNCTHSHILIANRPLEIHQLNFLRFLVHLIRNQFCTHFKISSRFFAAAHITTVAI